MVPTRLMHHARTVARSSERTRLRRNYLSGAVLSAFAAALFLRLASDSLRDGRETWHLTGCVIGLVPTLALTAALVGLAGSLDRPARPRIDRGAKIWGLPSGPKFLLIIAIGGPLVGMALVVVFIPEFRSQRAIVPMACPVPRRHPR